MCDDKNDKQLHVVLGAGGIGSAVARILCANGEDVKIVSRSGKGNYLPKNIEIVKADLENYEEAIAVTKGAYVVYHCVQPKYTQWKKYLPSVTEKIIYASSINNAKLVYADNVFCYGKVAGELTEDLPYNATGDKGKVRAFVSQMILRAHAEGRLRAIICRSPDFFGPGVTNAMMSERLFDAALKGRPVSVLGDIDTKHTYTFIDDFAASLIILAKDDKALGHIWHVPSDKALTTREFVELVYRTVGNSTKIRTIKPGILKFLSIFSPMIKEVNEMLYQYESPLVVNDKKFQENFSYRPTPIQAAVEKTVKWCREKQYVAH